MKSLTNWFRKVLPKQSTDLSDSPERVESVDPVSAILAEAQDRIRKYPGLRVTVIPDSPTANPNWRPGWLERWGYRVPAHLEIRKLSERELQAEKNVRELVEKALADRREAGIEND